MKAFILAGGMGTRMRPLTENRPKPLLPFANLPLAQHTVRLLQQQGVDEFVFLLHYLPEAFPATLGDGSASGCRMKYVSISENLGTTGCIKHVEKEIDQTALIFSGDLIADLDLKSMLKAHRDREAQISLAIRPEPEPGAYGVVQADARGRISRFQEKPSQAELFSNWISCGIYLVEPGFLRSFPDKRPLSFEREVFPVYAESRKAIYGFHLTGYWRDIGIPSSYLQAHADFLGRKLPAVYYQGAGQMISGGNLISATAVIGGNCKIDRSVIGGGCIVEDGTELRNCVLMEGAHLGRRAKLRNCVVGSNAWIEAGTEVSDAVIVSKKDDTPKPAAVGAGAIRHVAGFEASASSPALAIKAA